MPYGDVGLAVVLLTLLVKLATYPLTKKSIESQVALATLQPHLEAIKKEYPNKEEQAKKTFELYQSTKTNPFSGCLVLLIQMPIIFALYYVFLKGFSGTEGLLYSFIQMPGHLNTLFIGFIDISKPHLVLAILAGISQFVQLRVSLQNQPKPTVDTEKNTQQEMMRNMQSQMQYVLPILIVVIGLKLSGAIALYWITSNLIGSFQEYRIRQRLMKTI